MSVSYHPGYGQPITIQPGAPNEFAHHQSQPPPGAQPIPAAHGLHWMPMPPPMHNVPPGLEYLTLIDHLVVVQKKELIEIITDWEMRNRYVIKNANGEQVYYAFEESGCCTRAFCGNQRGWIIHIVDNFKREVLTLRRPFKYCASGGGACACTECCQQECIVESPSGGFMGMIRQRRACCVSAFTLTDSNGHEVFEIDGPMCMKMMGCQDKEFAVTSQDGATLGAVTKRWGGCFREAFTDADVFSVNFPMDLEVKMKGVILGATFLIDYMEFEQTQKKQTA